MNVKKININKSGQTYGISSDDGYLYAGIATPTTDPGTPDTKVAYFANTAGTYVHFDNITVEANQVVALYNINGSWESHEITNNTVTTDKIVDGAVTTEKLADSAMSQAMNTAIIDEIARAQAAEQANSKAIYKLINKTDFVDQKQNEITEYDKISFENESGEEVVSVDEVGLNTKSVKIGETDVKTELDKLINKTVFVAQNQNDIIEYDKISFENESGEEVVSVDETGLKATNIKIDEMDVKTEIDKLNNKSDFVDLIRLGIKKWLFIGDSVTHGFISDYPNNGYFVEKVSSPLFMSKLTGITTVNAGHGSWNCKEWWQYVYSKIDYTTIDLCTIEMGYNRGLTDTLSEDVEPFDDYNDYADTDTGCYCKIIEGIRMSNSDIIIILIVSSNISSNSTTCKVIEKIANKYGLKIVYLNSKDVFDLSADNLHGYLASDSVNKDMVHFNAIGYLYKSELLWFYIKKLLSEMKQEINRLIEVKNGVV